MTVPGGGRGPGGPLRSQEGESEPLSEWGPPPRSKSPPAPGGSTRLRDAEHETARVRMGKRERGEEKRRGEERKESKVGSNTKRWQRRRE